MSDAIIVVPYDPAWPELFFALGSSLRASLQGTALRIDHIGSTSVPGLAAKPIIDVQISVASFEPLAAIRDPLTRLGFVHRADNIDLTKRYFREAPGERRTHIHVRQVGSWGEQFALLFRDFMRCHDDDAQRYAELKYKLAEQYRDKRGCYVNAKGPFIGETMMKATAWSMETGWMPGPSDA